MYDTVYQCRFRPTGIYAHTLRACMTLRTLWMSIACSLRELLIQNAVWFEKRGTAEGDGEGAQ